MCIYICHIYKHRQKEFIQQLVKEALALLYFAIKVAKTSRLLFPQSKCLLYIIQVVDSDFLILVTAQELGIVIKVFSILQGQSVLSILGQLKDV